MTESYNAADLNNFTEPPKKSNRNLIIAIIVAVVVLCCCCVGVMGIVLWTYGDQIFGDLNGLNSILPALGLI